MPLGHGKLREGIFDRMQLQLAALGNLHRPCQHLGRIGKEPLHLLRAFHIELVAVEAEAFFIVNLRARLHAQHHVVGVRVLAAQVMRVVGRHQRNIQFLFQFKERLVNPLFFLEALVLNLQVKVALAEDVLVLLGHAARLFVAPGQQLLAQFPGQAARQADQALRVLGQITLADARLAIKAVQRSLGGDPHQIPVALLVLGQHEQMVALVALARSAMVLVLADVELAAQDRLDPFGLGGRKKVHRPVDVPVVGHRHRLLPQGSHTVHEFMNVASPVQQRVLGMQMQMREFGHGYSNSSREAGGALRPILVRFPIALRKSRYISPPRRRSRL